MNSITVKPPAFSPEDRAKVARLVLRYSFADEPGRETSVTLGDDPATIDLRRSGQLNHWLVAIGHDGSEGEPSEVGTLAIPDARPPKPGKAEVALAS